MNGRAWARSAAAALVLAAIVGCGGFDPFAEEVQPVGFMVFNYRSDRLAIETVGVSPAVSRIAPYGGIYLTDVEGCLGDGAIARDLEGTQVAELARPLCDGEAWRFQADGTVEFVRKDGRVERLGSVPVPTQTGS
jgi:hypothetical protein